MKKVENPLISPFTWLFASEPRTLVPGQTATFVALVLFYRLMVCPCTVHADAALEPRPPARERFLPFLFPGLGGAVQGPGEGRERPAAAHDCRHSGLWRRRRQQQLVKAFEASAGAALRSVTVCRVFAGSWQPVIDHIDSKFEDYLNSESRVNRRQMPDSRIHCCLYFIAPSGHGLVPH